MRATHRAAFAAEGADEAESVSALAVALLRDPTARPCLSLLAERDGAVLGSALFTTVRIGGDGTQPRAAILCPLAVVPDAQHSGVGTALIETGVR
ncbi:MAG: GNAT family N-acetyltransferase, partial [Pseudomonadales bacterium]|nr:GNAT family N-acetyltransferase [Pseudomonadales bacterium]